jgi:copper chaperone CopZ
MNHRIQTLIAATLVFAAGVSTAATSVKATVNGMVCAFCAQGIEKRLSKLPAAKAVHIDLKQKVVAVEAREGQVLDTQVITREIIEAGYEVKQVETVELSVDEIKAAGSTKGKK